ncbi:alpha/beta fold hydrolase [Ideonella paludis]|uniref:Alpha/beta hydrolase n=1 Tax=Ideonella paludis TaxID=1233411 RepID=A0ABS5DWR5_9BURK|nr:alpha/beta hydrolase [Ideonella paludis]MBQ0935591.1 alpha/beta hydrolase [Ideonella paludis]
MKMMLWRGLGLLLMLTAMALPLMRAIDRPVESLVGRWAMPPSDFMEVDGQLVHWRDEGPRQDPHPIVFLHGVAASLHVWEAWAQDLSPRHRIIRLDLPGFGLTGPLSESHLQGATADYSAENLARFTWRVLNELKVEQATIVGHDLGGEVAWRLALMAPSKVQRLVLMGATGWPDPPQRQVLGLRMARWPVLGALGDGIMPRALVARSLADTYAQPERITPEQVDRYHELLLRDGNRAALRQFLAQPADHDAVTRLKVMSRPTLLIWGQQDLQVPPAAGERFARLMPHARLLLLPHVGHQVPEEQPGLALEALRTFMRQPLGSTQHQ